MFRPVPEHAAARLAVLAMLAALAATASTQASAGHRHHRSTVHLGVHFGAPLHVPVWPRHYYAPRYYYPVPAVAVPAAPPAYVERGDLRHGHAPGYWYYCGESGAYYPYVRECAGGWQQVTPQTGNP